MKYKLIKEYPGSPELGTVVDKTLRSEKNYFYRSGDKRICVLDSHVEDKPEYWEKINESSVLYMVFTEKSEHFYKTFLTADFVHEGKKYNDRVFFKTKEEAEDFILYNKPCLSYNDVLLRLSSNKKLDLDCLEELVKSLI